MCSSDLLVISTRGAHGGYQLSRPPEAIRMSDVLQALEGPIAPMSCASDDPAHAAQCGRNAACTVNVMWVRVRDAISGALDAMTLADLVPSRLVHPGRPGPAATALPAPARGPERATAPTAPAPAAERPARSGRPHTPATTAVTKSQGAVTVS